MKKVFVSILVVLSLAVITVPQFSLAAPRASLGADSVAGCTTLQADGLRGVVNCLIDIFNIAIYLMIAGAIVFIMWGAFNMIASEEKREAGKQTIYYGIIGLFVMTSIWGLVNILNNTFGLSTDTTSTTTILNKTFIK